MPNILNVIQSKDIVDDHNEIADLTPGLGKHSTGHETFHHLYYNHAPIIVKKNKKPGLKGEDASLLEVAFSAITKLFMRPGLTPQQNIMMNEGNIIGVTSQNMSCQIAALLEAGRRVFKLKDASGNNLVPPWDVLAPTDEGMCGYAFLNDTPQYFFDELMKLQEKGVVVLDMDSLACILATSYVLEEDDFHKGNFGFYVIEDEGLPKITFFKIDHDLMFNDSIMSRKDTRAANIMYYGESFKITERDICGFPDLKDSKNHYWPTQWRMVTSGIKAYTRPAEREAFVNLQKNDAFIEAKWTYFLKIILTPRELILPALTHHLDANDDAVEMALVQTALNERLASLRQTLLGMKEFKAYVVANGEKILPEIKRQIKQNVADFACNVAYERLVDEAFHTVVTAIKQPRALCRKVMLGDYTFSGARGRFAIDESLNIARREFENAKLNDPSKAFQYACIIIDLHECKEKSHGCLNKKKSRLYRDALHFKTHYLRPRSITTFVSFQAAVCKIRQTRLPLVQQKKEVIELLQGSRLKPNELLLLRNAIAKGAPKSPLIFVRQLRNTLWFIKWLYGTYGHTKTVQNMQDIIDAKMKALPKAKRTKTGYTRYLFWDDKSSSSDRVNDSCSEESNVKHKV